jgi:hypothetical protein
MPETALIICGALAREVLAMVKRHGWSAHVTAISAREHMTPANIARLVEDKIRALLPRFERIAVIYGDCGTAGALDRVLAAYNVPRISGPHCYEMYAGAAAHDALMSEQPGTFFLTDYLLRGFDGMVWKGLGLDRHPELRNDYFAHYTRLVYLAQEDDVALAKKAQAVADRLGLPLRIVHTACGALEARLVDLMNTIGELRHAPSRPQPDHEYHVSNPVLARHPVAGARTRRPRTL